MPSLSLSVFCFMPSPWMLLLRPASGRPVPTPSRPHHSLPLGTPSTSFTAGRGPGNRGAFRANLYILDSKFLMNWRKALILVFF